MTHTPTEIEAIARAISEIPHAETCQTHSPFHLVRENGCNCGAWDHLQKEQANAE